MDGPWGHYAEISQTEKDNTVYYHLYMESKQQKKNPPKTKMELIDTENWFVVDRDRRWGREKKGWTALFCSFF